MINPVWQRRFERFHAANPQVYEAFVEAARTLKARGYVRYSSVTIFCKIRYDRDVSTDGHRYKLNQNFQPSYARLAMVREADLKDFFPTRERLDKR